MCLSRSSATIRVAIWVLSPLFSMFCVESIEFDACLGLTFRLEEEQHGVARRF